MYFISISASALLLSLPLIIFMILLYLNKTNRSLSERAWKKINLFFYTCIFLSWFIPFMNVIPYFFQEGFDSRTIIVLLMGIVGSFIILGIPRLFKTKT